MVWWTGWLSGMECEGAMVVVVGSKDLSHKGDIYNDRKLRFERNRIIHYSRPMMNRT